VCVLLALQPSIGPALVLPPFATSPTLSVPSLKEIPIDPTAAPPLWATFFGLPSAPAFEAMDIFQSLG